jgi:phage terminase large subunit
MMQIDFNKAFPVSDVDGSQGPLPKQQLMIDKALDPGMPKYVRYVGGIGSGKTRVLCAIILILAVMYPGDYLLGRLFGPELKDTTLQTFLEIIRDLCPQLMIEHRVADGVVLIRSRNKGVSRVLFRGLDEPDKLRSLNLNAFGIDEANQCSEAAFTVLQGRLRGKHVRKGFLVQNSGGHDWTWRYFVKKDFPDPRASELFFNIKAPSTENVHLPAGYVESALATWSEERIRREIYADEDAFEGQVYSEFRRDVHVVQPFKIPEEWTRVVGADHGFRNPACWLWGAVDYDGNIVIYREFYKKEWLIEEIVKGKKKPKVEPGVLDLMKDPHSGKYETIQQARLDPSVNKRNGKDGLTEWSEYLAHLPEGFPLLPANNKKEAGIDRVKTYLKVNPRTGRPRLIIFSTCVNLLEEVATYRYEELPTGQQGKKNEKEEPRKVNDHACDALRYLVMSQPEPPSPAEDIWNKVKYNSLEGSLLRDLQSIKKPKSKDPFGF